MPHSPFEGLEGNAINLRNRVSWTALYNTAADLATGSSRSSSTFYNYDIHGNVKELLQEFNATADECNTFKKIVYDYNLVSGKVNKVTTSQDDAENRLTNVETSYDDIYWENDAFYQYYKHGPLARMVLGQQQVQGVDYAYTLQGWLKGINSTALIPESDMGQDGAAGSLTARDALGFGLHYFGEREYHSINNTVHPFVDVESAGSNFKPLFNGNIAAISLTFPKVAQSTGLPDKRSKQREINGASPGRPTTGKAALAINLVDFALEGIGGWMVNSDMNNVKEQVKKYGLMITEDINTGIAKGYYSGEVSKPPELDRHWKCDSAGCK